jgi:hypothetical protein
MHEGRRRYIIPAIYLYALQLPSWKRFSITDGRRVSRASFLRQWRKIQGKK